MIIERINYEQTWPIRHEVMWPDQDLDYVKLEEDPIGIHFGLFVEEQLTSVISLFIEEEGSAQFRKFATLVEHQGKGYGGQLLSYLIDFAIDKGANKIWCNARADKVALYEKYDMMETDKKYEKGGLQFVIMERLL